MKCLFSFLVKKGHERPKYGNLHSDQTLNLVYTYFQNLEVEKKNFKEWKSDFLNI